jgi:hypothetical protein
MAVSLTSTGIIFPTGNAQDRPGGYKKMYTTTLSGTSTTYSWGTISPYALKILIVFSGLSTNSGPNTVVLSCQYGVTSATTGVAQSEFTSTSSTSGILISNSNSTNLWKSSGYNQFPLGFLELTRFSPSSSRYTYEMHGWSSGQVTRGNGQLTVGSTTSIDAITLSTGGSNYWTTGTVSLYQA